MIRNYSFLITLVLLISCNQQPIAEKEQAVSSGDELVRASFQSSQNGEQRDFFVYLPHGYGQQPDKAWPVILFLHGDGERGNSRDELKYVLKHGPLYEAWIQKKPLPFVIVSPQLPVFGRDTLGLSYLVNRDPADFPDRLDQGVPDRATEGTSNLPMSGFANPNVEDLKIPERGWELVEDDLLKIIDKVLNDYQVDKNRLYLTGLSYGGFGTWHMISKHPDLFAAASPIVGWGHPDLMQPIAERNLPLWVFSGGRDGVVEKRFFIPGINRLEELGHTNLRYTIHEDMSHDVWKRVYSGDDIYNWFLHHSKSNS